MQSMSLFEDKTTVLKQVLKSTILTPKNEKKNIAFLFVLSILLVQFGLLSGHLLGNSCPLGEQFVLIVLCLFVIFIHFPVWFKSGIFLGS